jgi:biotin carboxylase
MQGALRRFRIAGVATTRDLALRIVSHPAFHDAALSTSFLDRHGLLV